MARRKAARKAPLVAPQPASNAFRAATTARSTSGAVPAGARCRSSPVAGFSTSKVPPAAGACQPPSMKSWSRIRTSPGRETDPCRPAAGNYHSTLRRASGCATFSDRLPMTRATRISNPEGDALLRPFRFEGLEVGHSASFPGSDSGGDERCDVLLDLDFAGASTASLDARLGAARRRIGDHRHPARRGSEPFRTPLLVGLSRAPDGQTLRDPGRSRGDASPDRPGSPRGRSSRRLSRAPASPPSSGSSRYRTRPGPAGAAR